MTKTILATAAILFAASAQAADSRMHDQGVTTQPGVGADFDRYQGFADANPDLFSVDLGTSTPHERPDIYGPFGASPDISY